MTDNMEGAQYTQPIYYKFRYTFDNQNENTINDPSINSFKYKNLCHLLKKNLDKYTDKMTFGIEGFNSKRERTFYHVHFHFSSSHNREAIARSLKRLLQSLDHKCTGVKCFSLKPEVFINETKFFQYPLKQYDHDLSDNGLAYKCSTGFSIDEINKMRGAAHASWLVAVEINQGKSDKNGDGGDSLFSRILSRIQKKRNIINYVADIYREIIEVYLEEDKPINLTTIRGYGLTIATKVGIIDATFLVQKLVQMDS